MKFLHKTLTSVGIAAIAAFSIFDAPATAFSLKNALNPVKIMPLGDSNTRGKELTSSIGKRAGYRDDLWAMFQDNEFHVDFVGSQKEGRDLVKGQNGTYQFDKDHEGHGGYAIKGPGSSNSPDLVSNIASWLNQANPDVVMLMAGTNDFLYQDTTAEKTLNELGQLIDKIFNFSSDLDLFLAAIPPMNLDSEAEFEKYGQKAEQIEKYNNLLPGFLQQDRFKSKKIHFVDTRNLFTNADFWDRIHFTNQGYNKLANAWFDSLVSVADNEPEPQPVPESSSVLSILLFGACTAVCLHKRKPQFKAHELVK